MRLLTAVSVLVTALAGTSITATAIAQDRPGAANPGQFGVLATTPSRMEGSRREMNRGRERVWRANMTPAQTRRYAQDALTRGGFQCDVAEAVVVAQTRDGAPLVEVDCVEGGGLIIADANPMIATDCLDLGPDAGIEAVDGGRIEACRLPANVASVTAERQSARN